jgi:hypothetical protein
MFNSGVTNPSWRVTRGKPIAQQGHNRLVVGDGGLARTRPK